MSTVGSLVDRLYREFLAPSARTPSLGSLSSAVDDTTTSIPLDVTMLGVEEQTAIAPGVVLEVGLEQMLISAYDEGTTTATVSRGYNGTAAASHSSGDLFYPAPEFARQVAFDAVADEIVSLHPTLWGKRTLSTTTDVAPIEVDDDVVGVASVLWDAGGSTWLHGNAVVLPDFPPSSTGKALQFKEVSNGKTAHVTLKCEFSRPTAEADTTASLLLEDSWLPIVVYGAAARLSAYVDPTRLRQDWSVERDQNEQVPVGSGTVLERRLRSVRNDLLEQAARRLHKEHPPVVVFRDPFRPSTRL